MHALWRDCVFVLDANVLLNFYRYTPSLLEKWFDIFERVSARVWVPFQAALEFYDNRIGVMLDQASQFDRVVTIVDNYRSQLQAEIAKLNLDERHSTISPKHFLEEISHASIKFIDEVKDLGRKYEANMKVDPLLVRIEKLLDGRTGSRPESQDVLDKIYADGSKRYSIGMPPGFADKKEKEGKLLIYQDLIYKKEYGDYVLWKELLTYSNARSIESVVLVTDDKKQDWWWTEKGGRKQGPRRELVEEIRRESNVRLFHMYSPDRFLFYVAQYLGIEVEEASIRQVRFVSEEKKRKNFRRPIPDFSTEAVVSALRSFDNDVRSQPEWMEFPRRSRGHHKYAIRHNGNFYPVKKIISMVTGIATDDFSGGEQANGRMLRLGFDIVRISELGLEEDLLDQDEDMDER